MISVCLCVWRMWFCTTSPDRLLASALCYRGPRSLWSLSPVGLLRSSPPGSPRPQTATCPSDPPSQPPSLPTLRAGRTLRQLNLGHKNLKLMLSWLKDLRNVCTLRRQHRHLKIRRKPKMTFQRPQTASPQPRVTELSERSPDCLLMNAKLAPLSQTRRPEGPGASLRGEEFCCGASRHCPNSSIMWCPSTGSTSTRGSSG